MSEDKPELLEEKKKELKEEKELGYLDSNFPLLKEFREKAPGSYKHAQSLVSIIENVCAAIDMDPEILKIAAMYHDIGKMWNPKIFTENQLDDKNIHDELSPEISYQLITRHVSDTVTILIAYGFPIEVIKIASQHHGSCVLRPIAEKVDPKRIDEFRYKTQRPDSLESLILMFCDQVEAASRAIYRDSKVDHDPRAIVSNIYNKLHLDGQFDNVTVLLGNLKSIQEAIIADVASNYHKRIDYADDAAKAIDMNKPEARND